MKTLLFTISAAFSISTCVAQESIRDQLQDLGVILYTREVQRQPENQSGPVIRYVNGVPQMPEMHPEKLEYLQWDLDAIAAYGYAIDAYNARIEAQDARIRDEQKAAYDAKIRAEQIEAYNAKVIAYNEKIIAENKKRSSESLTEDPQTTAIRLWPDLGIQGSALNTRFLQAVKGMRAQNPNFFTNEDWPLVLARRCSAEIKSEESAFIERTNELHVKTSRAFPDVDNDNSPLARRMIQIADKMEADKNPLVYSPEAAWVIANMAAKELGIMPKK